MLWRTHNRRATDAAVATKQNVLAALLLAGIWLCAFARDASGDESVPPTYHTVVSAERNAFSSSSDVAASTSIVTKSRTPRSGESVEQLVAELPGVSVTRYGGNGATSTLSVRGSTANQVQVYVDGVPMNLATGGGVDLGFLPLVGMERLELFKGSSPITFGASGIGGILSITTEAPESSFVRGAASLGSWGASGLVVAGSYVLPRVRAFVSVAANGWRGDFDYENDDGLRLTSAKTELIKRSNNDLSQQDALLRLVFPFSPARSISVIASMNQREQGIPGYGLLRVQFARLSLTRQAAQLAYEGTNDLGPGSRVRGNIYALRSGQAFADWLGEYGVRTDTHDVHRAFGTTWQVSRTFGEFRVGAIADGRHEEFQPFDTYQDVTSGPPGTRNSAAVGIEPAYRFSRTGTEISPSVRLEISRDAVTSRSLFTNQPTASDPQTTALPVERVSVSQAVGQHFSLRSNVGRYVRAPSITERYGNTGYILPSPTLKPERGTNIDLGARLNVRNGSLGLQSDTAIFASWVDDLIQYRQNAQGRARALNLASAEIRGIEAAVSGFASRHFRVFVQSTYTHAVDTSGIPSTDGKQLPLRPAIRAYCRPELTSVEIGQAFMLGLYGDVDYTGRNYVDSPNLIQNGSRVLFGAGAHLVHKRSGIRAVLSATNLGNVLAYDYTGFPLPGRSIFLSLDWLTALPETINSNVSEGAS